MKRLFKSIMPLIVLFSGSLFAQTPFIPLTVDHAMYRGNDNKNYLEVYLSFYQNNLSYLQKENKYQADYIALVQVQTGDSIVSKNIKTVRSTVDSLGQISPTRQFINTFYFELPQGQYKTKVVVRDANSNKSGEYEFDFQTRPFGMDSLKLSDIQFASKISKSKTKDEFNKNTYHVLPNPSCTYSVALPIIYYYAETYNLNYSEEESGKYTVRCFIREYPENTDQKPGRSALHEAGYNIIALPSAAYLLNLDITDEQTGNIVHETKKFWMVKPNENQTTQKDTVVAFQSRGSDMAEYAGLSDEEMEAQFEQARYISTDRERKLFSTLDTNSKRIFLANFWRKFDPNPATEINEFRQDYFERVNYANANFGHGRKNGWKSERGRVLLQYGRPDNIERHYMATDSKPYEIWEYHKLEGGVIFVFADLRGFGDYELVHSTYSREINQPDWERLVKRTQDWNSDLNN
ncbi:MAG: GWxTD domain-containing protein [Calditrichia bacterium]